MNDLQTFPVQQFYEALMSSQGLEEKLDLILKQIRAKNTYDSAFILRLMTYQAIVHLHQILNSKLEPPLMKFNALNCAKIFFDTCEYPVILFIEVYLLPIIFEIAAFKATKKSEEGLSLYFIERGAQPTKQVKRLGFNHVSLAIEFIYATASVKMYRVLENEELEEESHFKKITKALKMRGVPQIPSFKFYNGSYIEQTRRIFIDKLQVFNPESFIDFITDLIFGQLTEARHPELDSKRLIMHGDVYIISPLVNRIEEQLNEIDGNFQGKRKILTLFYELIKFGYAEAILLLNSSDFLTSITTQISKVHGDKDMDEGRWIYQQIQDSQKEKKLFYLEFLKCIEVWSHAVPSNDQNQDSDAKKMFEFLKFQKKFKFPDNPNLHKYKSEMQIYLRQNNQRNQKVIELITKRQQSDAKSDAKSRYKISSLKDESNIKSRQKKTTMEFEQLQQIVINVMMVLEVVGFQEKRLDKEMKKLLKFKETWHKNLEVVKKKLNEDDQPYNLDLLISEGQIVYEQIIGLEKIYDEYKSNKINFEKAQEKISAFLNQLDEQNHVSEVSVSARSKNTRLTNRRDLKSKISQKARDRSFSNHSKHSKNSYVSQSKSAKTNLKNTQKYKNPQNIIKKSQPQKQIPKIYNPINETFAINQAENSLSYFAKKTKNLQDRQRLNKSRKLESQKIQNQHDKKSFETKNQYGVHQQMVKNNQIPTATFISVKSSDFQGKIKKKNENFNNPGLENNNIQKIVPNLKQKVIQRFEDSFEVRSPFKRKTQTDEKGGSKIVKKQQFSRVLFTSEDQAPLNEAIVSNQKRLSRVIEAQDQAQSQKKKQSLIKKILSSDKISFQNNQSSESEQQQPATRAQNNAVNNKMSKYLSFNNGNVSAYFNQQSGDQYGLVGNIKESLRYENKPRQVINSITPASEKTETRNLQKINVLAFDDDDDKKYKNRQKANDKSNTSKQISEIKPNQIQKVTGNFDDLQLENQNQSNVLKRNKSLLKSRLRDSRLKESRLRDSRLKDSRLRDSRQNHSQLRDSRMKNNLNDSQVSQVCHLDISEKIKQQDSFQMLQSHYRTRQVQQQKLKPSSSNNDLKFGEIVQVKKQIINNRNKVLSSFNHDQTDKTKQRMKKLIEMQNLNMNLKNSKKSVGLMEVLSQRTAKKGIEDYLIKKEKNKLIKNLNLRIKRLQNEQITIQKKLSKKDQQLRSISYKNYSQKQNMKFRNENVSLGSMQNSMRQYQSSNTSLHYRLNQQSNDPNKVYGLLSGQSRTSDKNLVDLSTYDKFFENFNDNSLKKNCLRNKSLILVNEEMEIGCMSIKKDTFINLTLFITPKFMSMKNVKFTTQPNQNLAISFFPDSLYLINAKKQQTLNIKICVQNVPFAIPKLKIEYQIESITKAHQNIHKSTIELILPCTFNRLCSFQSINVNDFYNMFNSGDSKNDIKTCQKFKLNSRVFKESKIKEFFPYLSLLKKIDENNGKSRLLYGFETNYNGNVFLVLLKIEDKKYVRIEAKNMTGQAKADKYIEFFMATFKMLIGH